MQWLRANLRGVPWLGLIQAKKGHFQGPGTIGTGRSAVTSPNVAVSLKGPSPAGFFFARPWGVQPH